MCDAKLNPRNSSSHAALLSYFCFKKELLYLVLSDRYNNKRGLVLLKFYLPKNLFAAGKESLKNILPLSFSWDAIQTPQPSFELASKGNV